MRDQGDRRGTPADRGPLSRVFGGVRADDRGDLPTGPGNPPLDRIAYACIVGGWLGREWQGCNWEAVGLTIDPATISDLQAPPFPISVERDLRGAVRAAYEWWEQRVWWGGRAALRSGLVFGSVRN